MKGGLPRARLAYCQPDERDFRRERTFRALNRRAADERTAAVVEAEPMSAREMWQRLSKCRVPSVECRVQEPRPKPRSEG